MMVGSADPNDTTLLRPTMLQLSDNRIAVFDGQHQTLRVFTDRGDLLWSWGARGRGPGEIENVSAMEVSPDGNLWLLDGRNRKVVVLSRSGELLEEISLQHLPIQPGVLLAHHGDVVLPAPTPHMGVLITDTGSFHVRSTIRFPWEETIPDHYNVSVALASGRDSWALALHVGPGFTVIQTDTVRSHRYIDPVFFALKSGPRVREIGADSARYGAHSLDSVGDELFMLFGGRPNRAAHPGEPTEVIDVYGWDGTYRRSYRLPLDAEAMATRDGETFYILTHSEGGYPLLLALRPITAMH